MLSLNSVYIFLILIHYFLFLDEKQIYHGALCSILYNARLAVIKFWRIQPETFERPMKTFFRDEVWYLYNLSILISLMMRFDVYTISPSLYWSEKCVPSAIVFKVCCKNEDYRFFVNMVQFDSL